MSQPIGGWSQTKWYASEDVAHWLGVKHADLYRSFLNMSESWPEVLDCGVEFSTSTAKNGLKFASLLMTGAALAAFLYWREHHGKPDRFFTRMGFRLVGESKETLQ